MAKVAMELAAAALKAGRGIFHNGWSSRERDADRENGYIDTMNNCILDSEVCGPVLM